MLTQLLGWKGYALAGVAGAAVAIAPAYLVGHSVGAAHQKDRTAAAAAVAVQGAMKTDSAAKETAADERLADERAVSTLTEKLTDAVAAIPDDHPDAVAVRLGCQRLRNAGTDVSGLPACR